MNLEDIARLAGVSRSTVSRVVNHETNVNPQTRERVLDVIRQQRYQPNAAARTLVTQRTEVIGVVIPSPENIFFTDNSYFPMLLAGLGQATRDRDYAMLLWLGQVADNDERMMNKITNYHLTDGLVVASMTREHPMYERLATVRRPVVMIDKPYDAPETANFVSIDNIAAAYMATCHLIALGRQRIGHITGHLTISDGRDRLIGYKQALSDAGREVDEQLIYTGTFRREAGYNGLHALAPYRPDAILAGSDTVALGIIQAARELGLQIPDDLAVIGFDDVDVAATISLTTVRQPVQYKGEVAANLLLDLISGALHAPQQILLPTELVIRQSCGGIPLAV